MWDDSVHGVLIWLCSFLTSLSVKKYYYLSNSVAVTDFGGCKRDAKFWKDELKRSTIKMVEVMRARQPIVYAPRKVVKLVTGILPPV